MPSASRPSSSRWLGAKTCGRRSRSRWISPRPTVPRKASSPTRRSQQSLEATGPITTAGGIPGALSNQPPQPAQSPIEAKPPTQQGASGANPTPPSTQTSNANRKESTVNYEVDRAIQTVKGGRGQVRRVSAAVILNYKKGADKAGKPTSLPFGPEELKQINQMVRDAMGFSQQRGDSVSVANIPFNVEPVEEVPVWREAGVIEISKEAIKFALLAAVVGIVFFAVVRPLLFPPPAPPEDETTRLELDKERRRLEEEEKRMQEDEVRTRAEEEKRRTEDERKRLDEDKQREYEELIAYAKDYVTKDARVVAQVFKDWLSQTNDKPKS